MTSSYRTITFLPCQRIPAPGACLPGVEAAVPLLSPPSPHDVQKWDSVLSRRKIWYVDGDGDEITVKTLAELVAGIRDLEGLHSERFVFQFWADENGGEILNELAGLSEGKNSDVDGFELTGDVESVESGERTRMSDGHVNIGSNVQIGSNVSIHNEPAVSSEDLDMITPSSSPTRSSHRLSIVNDETSLIDLPCIPNQVPHPPLTPLSPAQPNPSSSHPSSPASETAFPDIPFPGAFPQDLPTEFTVPNLQEVQSGIAKAVQSTLDALAQIGHRTIIAAQTTGFPVQRTESFNEAHAAVDRGAESIRRTVEEGFEVMGRTVEASISTAGRTVETSLSNAGRNVETSFGKMGRNVTQTLDTARTNLEHTYETALTNLHSTTTQLPSPQSSPLSQLSSSLTRARTTLSSASRQVDSSLAQVTQQLLRTGGISEESAERVVREVRRAGGRMERVLEEVGVRLQRRINDAANGGEGTWNVGGRAGGRGSVEGSGTAGGSGRATEDSPQEIRVIWENPESSKTQESSSSTTQEPQIPPPSESQQPPSKTQSPQQEDEEDIYGTTPLPGSFPRLKTNIEECTDALIELGYFTREQRDFAGAVSVVAEGDVGTALEIMEGRGEQRW